MSLARPEARFGVAAAALLAVVVALQFPASRLHSESRLASTPFRWHTDAERAELEKQSFMMFMPEKNSLRFAALGNDSLAASYVWIKTAGYVTREFGSTGGRIEDRRAAARTKFEWLDRFYNTVFDLDPHWVGAIRVGAMILAAVGEDPGGAADLLEKGMYANPDSWVLPYEAGATSIFRPGHEEDAVRYFRRAMMLPGHNPAIGAFLPRLQAEAGRLDFAISLARRRSVEFAGRAMGDAARRQLTEFIARQMQNDLEEASRAFVRREGRPSENFTELRRAGYLARLDRHFAEEVVLFAERLGEIVALHRDLLPGEPPPSHPAALAESGFINEIALAGRIEPPESADPYGKPFLLHPVTGAVRSLALAERDTGNQLNSLRAAAVAFARREGRQASSLNELGEYYRARMAAGRQIPQQWTPVFREPGPPAHPLADWGGVYVMDPATGRIDERLPEELQTLLEADLSDA